MAHQKMFHAIDPASSMPTAGKAITMAFTKIITLPLCQRYGLEILLLTEKEIEESIRLLFEQHRLVVEGSGALAVGGLLKNKARFKGKKVVAVACGRNINLEVFKRIIQ